MAQRGPLYQTFTFRQPQRLNPLALRRLQLQDIESQRRAEIAAGNQELASIREMARLKQDEYKIRTQIKTEKQVASASREITALDPETMPDYMMRYADVMSRHPLAANDKFLNEAFTHGMQINQKVVSHRFAQLEELTKQSGREDIEWIKAAGRYAALGGDPSTIATNPDGSHNFNALFAAEAKVRAEYNARAEDAKKGLEVKRVVDADGKETVTYEEKKPEMTPAQEFSRELQTAGLQGRQEILTAQNATLQKTINDPNKSDEEKQKAQAQFDNNAANMGALSKQLDVLHGAGFGGVQQPAAVPTAAAAVTPSFEQKFQTPLPSGTPVNVVGGQAAPVTPPAAAPAATLGPKQQRFEDEWKRLSGVMTDAQSRADAARAERNKRESAIQGNSLFNDPFSTDLKKNIAESNQFHDTANQADQDWRNAMKARDELLQQHQSAFGTPTGEKPPVDLNKFLPPPS